MSCLCVIKCLAKSPRAFPLRIFVGRPIPAVDCASNQMLGIRASCEDGRKCTMLVLSREMSDGGSPTRSIKCY